MTFESVVGMNLVLHEVFNRAFERKAIDYAQSFVDDPASPGTREKMKQLIFYGIRAMDGNHATSQSDMIDITLRIVMADYIHDLLTELTPSELTNIFPIEKNNKNNSLKSKEYLSTMKRLYDIGMNNPIGCKIHEVLSNYLNKDIIKFCFIKNEAKLDQELIEGF